MGKRLILHVGTTKTGTTGIQSFLAQNAAALQGQGMCYPVFPGRFKAAKVERNGHFLARSALLALKPGKERPDDAQLIPTHRRLFEEAVAAHETVILSEEIFWSYGVQYAGFWETVRAQAQEAGVEEFTVIAFVRRQEDYAESRWNQAVKEDKCETRPFSTHIKAPLSRKIGDYQAGLEGICKAFGRENVRVGLFDRSRLSGGDVLPEFMHLAGIRDGHTLKPLERDENPRLSNNMAEVKRIVNQAPSYRAYKNFLREPMERASTAQPAAPRTTMFTAAERAEFEERYAPGNEQVAREYFGFEEGGPFSPSKAAGAPTWEYDDRAMLRETILFVTEALTAEHQRAEELAARLSACEERLARVEHRQEQTLAKRVKRKMRRA